MAIVGLGTDIVEIARIEQSLSVSPFWLDGHWLSARAAMALGNTDCAEAIREALKAFVDRLPQLAELTFNDGTPFLSDDGADWLHTAPAAGKGTGAGANPWEQAFDGALELVRQNKLAPAMELLEQGLADAREPRERFYWRLATARLLKETGLHVEVETSGYIEPGDEVLAMVDQWNVSPKLASAAVAPEKQPQSLEWLSHAREPYLKFVLHKTEEIAEVDALLIKFGLTDFPSHRIIISPGGKQLSHMEPRLLPLAKAALERGWSFTPRLHVILWGDKRGV